MDAKKQHFLFSLYYLQLFRCLRFQKSAQNKEMNFSTSSGVETQASKRQKLEDGLLRKVCKLFYSSSSDYLINEKVDVIFV